MNNVKTVRVGMMPGKIEEFAVEVGTDISNLVNEIAGLDSTGYDIKVDGTKITDEVATVDENTNLVLLVQKVKGNADGMVRVGMMPGKIEEFAVENGTSLEELLGLAGLDATGYDVKVDGVKRDLNYTTTSETSLVLLVKRVKGNK